MLFQRLEIDRRDRLIRRMLQRQLRKVDEGTPEAKALKCTLEHEDCFAAAAAAIESSYAEQEQHFWAAGVGFGGPLQNFLDWFMQNWPAILEMIKSIIDLFSQGEPSNG